MHVCLCNQVLVKVDVQRAGLPFTADHEWLVETAETLSVQTLTPVCEDPPHLLIQSLTQLSIIHMHFLSTADVWQEMSVPENLDNTCAKNPYKQMGRAQRECRAFCEHTSHHLQTNNVLKSYRLTHARSQTIKTNVRAQLS